MVYLVWQQMPWREERPKLIGAWGSEDEARKQCEERAATIAEGSGRITESLMGDSWEVMNSRSELWFVRLDALPFGRVDA